MDRVSSWMVRLSLCWLILGMSVGTLMFCDRWVPGRWRVWMAPAHAHMLFVGWFLQFALGIGIWLLPRTRSVSLPLGYHEKATIAAIALLNTGLLLRVGLEPVSRSGRDSNSIELALVVSALLQMIAVATLSAGLWPRVAPRAPRKRMDTANPVLAKE